LNGPSNYENLRVARADNLPPPTDLMPSEALTYTYQEISLYSDKTKDSADVVMAESSTSQNDQPKDSIDIEVARNPLPDLFRFLDEMFHSDNKIDKRSGKENLAALVGSITNRAVRLFDEKSVGLAFGGHVIAEADVGNSNHALMILPYKGQEHQVRL